MTNNMNCDTLKHLVGVMRGFEVNGVKHPSSMMFPCKSVAPILVHIGASVLAQQHNDGLVVNLDDFNKHYPYLEISVLLQGLIHYKQGERIVIKSPIFEDQKSSVISLTNTFIDELGDEDGYQYIYNFIAPYLDEGFGTEELKNLLIQITNEVGAKRTNKMTLIQLALTSLMQQCYEIGLLEFYTKLDYVCRGEFGMLAGMKKGQILRLYNLMHEDIFAWVRALTAHTRTDDPCVYALASLKQISTQDFDYNDVLGLYVSDQACGQANDDIRIAFVKSFIVYFADGFKAYQSV